MNYDPAAIERTYREIWKREKTYSPDLSQAKNPYYNLMMFPYPSAEGLHVGNMYAFTGADVHGRFQRMQGYDVFEPIGLDGFGIHSENYAIKVGRHPADQAKISEENFYRQLDMIGNGFAWDHRLETYDPEYYRWTQWLFAEMFRRGLAYRAEAMVNWCPSCKTVLSDEQVEDGECERCGSKVERREMSSWYLKITDYSDRLLDNIDQYAWNDVHGEKHVGLDWPNKVTIAQKNWIGRGSGVEIDFAVENSDRQLTVWTKFWETVFGVTYLVVAPEHEFIVDLTTPEQKADVDAYVTTALNKSEQQRKEGEKDKTGVFTGSFVVNPANGERVPVWIADYVLAGVGTGAVMGVPAHDERDFDFAKKFDLPIRQVVAYEDFEINTAVSQGKKAHEGEGKLVNSAQFDGQQAWGEGKDAMKLWIISQGFGREKTTYHLRDWLISRQRYWGPPIPMVFCQSCADQNKGERAEMPGWYAVPDQQLPVELPYIENFKPEGDGTSPLDNAPDTWKHTACPGCGGQAIRETDVSDTFLDSSWYFLRYPAVDAQRGPFPHVAGAQKGQRARWFPVDAYIGGAEHAVLHLLYSRFVTMALYDWDLVPLEEPFPYLFGHGLIIKDGAKMSKSKGNVVNPDEYIKKYGADALRAYLMFLGPYDQGGDFRDAGMHSMHKWLSRVWETVSGVTADVASDQEIERQLNQVIMANTKDMPEFKFNTSLARLMEVVNAWRSGQNLSVDDVIRFLQLLAPFAPYTAEQLYQDVLVRFGRSKGAQFHSIHSTQWPLADEAKANSGIVEVAVQVNGKLRGTVQVTAEESQNKTLLEEKAAAIAAVQKFRDGKETLKTIVVPGRIVNFVIKV